MATEHGITGWQPGDAIEAAASAFDQWLQARGGSGQGFEATEALNRVRVFIERYGGARFQLFEATEGASGIHDRAGWVKSDGNGGKVYLFTPAAFREALGDIDPASAAQALHEAGWIAERDNDTTKPYQWKPRIPSLGNTTRVYAIRTRDTDANESAP